MNSKKILSTLLLLVGIVLLVVSVLADVIGIGRSPEFGYTQIGGVVLGAIVAILGWVLLRKKAPPASQGDASAKT